LKVAGYELQVFSFVIARSEAMKQSQHEIATLR